MVGVRNPFFNRHRITNPAYFCGREEELEQLFGAILTGQCRSIVGERKIGKSSTLTHLAHPETQRRFGLEPERSLFVYLDLEGVASATRSEFWQEVLDRIYAGLREEELRTLFQEVLRADTLRFMRVRRLLRRVHDAGYRIILILDEFEALARSTHFEPDFYGELRSLAGEVGVIYLTASKRSLYELTYRHSTTLSSPFFNIFSELPLGLMPEGEVHQLLTHISNLGEKRRFGKAEINLALDWAGAHPFFAQLAGYHLWETLIEEDPPSPKNLEKVHRRFLAEVEDHYRYFWSQLEESERTGILYPKRVTEDVRRKLQRRGLIQQHEKGWTPFSTSFADFVQRQEDTTPSTPILAVSAGEDLTGKSIGPYRVLERCGQGGMADVYKGYHPLIDRYVAIKVLRATFADDEEFRTRFQREATAVARLRHPNIVQLYDFGQLGDRYYMVMEFIDGGSLRERLQRLHGEGKRSRLSDIVIIMRGLAAALDYAHRREIVHRDVKPSNVMFTPEGDPVLTDFGIARVLKGGSLTMVGMSVGTPDYMSPEQGMGEPATASSDIYSLGVVLYEMLVGRRPFAAETPFGVVAQHIHGSFPSPRGQDPSFSEDLDRILQRSLAKNPEDRYHTAGEMAQELQVVVENNLEGGA
jgi:tRNA A-37 threonylcarbamoyl transferase component Bud32